MHDVEELLEGPPLDSDFETEFVCDGMRSFFSVYNDNTSGFGEFDERDLVLLDEIRIDEILRRARVDKGFDFFRDSHSRCIPDRRTA